MRTEPPQGRLMHARRSLLERLRPESPQRTHSRARDADELRRSIGANLDRILNSREGMAPACTDYGFVDLTQLIHGLPERARELEEALARCVQQFEPRLADVRVEHRPDAEGALTACFRIRAALFAGGDRRDLFYQTTVDPSGRVRIG